MREIKFSKLTIQNFRNINQLEINFNDTLTEIIASNGKGKTNTLSAILWCLFGKDLNDNKQFTISPIINGIEDNSINTVVKLVINNNYIVERTYCKRVTSLKTGFIIDDKEQLVSITQTQFKQELLENLVDEDTFKSLTNINYLTGLNWKDLKKFIFELIGDIKDEEVLLRDDFKLIEDYIAKFGIDQVQKLLNDTDKDLNEDIKRLETEYQTLVNTKEKYVSNEEDNKKFELRKEEIEKELYSLEENQKEYNIKKQNYDSKKMALDNLQYEVKKLENEIEYNKSQIEDYNELYNKSGEDVEILRKRDLDNKNNVIMLVEDAFKRNSSCAKELENEIENLKVKGNEIKNKEIKIENSTCNSCGQSLPKEIIEKTLNNLKEEQKKQLLDLKKVYDSKKIELEETKNALIVNEKEKKELLEDLEAIKIKKYEVVLETDKQKQIRVMKEQKEIENKTKLELLNAKKKQLEADSEEFNSMVVPTMPTISNEALRVELNEINNKLATTITLGKISEDIEEVLKNLNTKKDNKNINKEKLQQVIKFNNVKADLLKQKIKSYFKLVNFRTKEYNADGIEQETFKIENNDGIEYKETNTAMKFLLGLELLDVIQKLKGIELPIIMDNVEAIVTDFSRGSGQLIVARAVKGIERIEVK